jgi:mRNA interferase MazF
VSYSRWAVVAVPFPFSDPESGEHRPAVVLSRAEPFGAHCGHSVLAMITSAAHRRWPLDIPITDLAAAGLPAPSVVRMKLFTLDDRVITRQIGALSHRDAASVARSLVRLLGWAGLSDNLPAPSTGAPPVPATRRPSPKP